jgi:serine/threonine protein kinase
MVTYEMLTGLPPWYTTDKEKLFERLRSAPLKFPFYVSRPAAMLISSFLKRNPLERLGSNGGSEVKSHPFFASMDWEGLYNRRIRPPFDPCKDQDIVNTDNFDREFTTMPLHSVDENSLSGPGSKSPDVDKDVFLNFTFEEESMLDSLRDTFRASRAASRSDRK